MTWAKFDDGYYDNPKLLRAGLTATGLHARAITYCAKQETDGFVPAAWVHGQLAELPSRERKRVLAALLGEALLLAEDDGYTVNDYLDYNPTRDVLRANRQQTVKKKSLFRNKTLVETIRDRDQNRCRYCGVKVNWKDRKGPTGGSYDHVQPRGDNTLENVVVACRECTTRKNCRAPEEAGMPLRPVSLRSAPDLDAV